MLEKPLDHKKSLDLITEMISQAKCNYSREGSFYFLLWGWVVMLANFGHYILQVYFEYPRPYLVWLATIPAGIISIVHGARRSKKTQVTSHLDRMYSQVWLAAGLGVVIALLNMSTLSFYHNAVILIFASMGTYISGHLLKFKPLILGGVALAISSIVAFQVSEINQYLVGGIGVLLGYLVPGYLLKNKQI